MDRWYRRLGKVVAVKMLVGGVVALSWPRYRQFWRARLHLGRVWLDYYGHDYNVSPMASDMLARASQDAVKFEPHERSAKDAFARRDDLAPIGSAVVAKVDRAHGRHYHHTGNTP